MKISPDVSAGPTGIASVGRTYLPIIDRPLDNTAMTIYKTCPREFLFSMVWHRRGEGGSPALNFGDGWHIIMQTHYRTGGNRDAVIKAAIKGWRGSDLTDDYRTLERAIRDYDLYIRTYGLDECRKTLGYPDMPIVEESMNALGNGLLHPWAGKLDRFYDDGGIFIEDHKTTSRLDKNYFAQYKVSNQMKGYHFLGKLFIPDRPVLGVRINLAHVLTKETKFYRELFTFSPAILKEWVENENVWMQRLARDYELLAQGARPGIEAFPGHYGDNGCSRKFGMCGYHRICGLDPSIRQATLEREFPVNPWNPLDHGEDNVE